ncbi:hypothetical protein FOMA001_g15485 [Fusarium oxysporum f. sp. matthiolae]|nr:hypothetical protein FOMA001_g15485 [Fusarium oxysporum f. sp. matthiolae]
MSGESKASLSFQYRWENILTPVPVALNALGACAVATGSQKANTAFAPPKEGFKHLRDWINHACELHRACVAAEPTSEDQQVLKDIELAVAGASIDYQQQISTNQFQKSLEAANEAFRRASDGLPKGWDIVGRQVVEKLADSLATALNQAMPTPSASKPKDADDPAYSQVVRDLIYWELLSTAFVGTTDGIAWDRTGQVATFAAKMLAHSQKSFGSLASGSEPSQQYKSALDSVCRIANGIMTEVEQSDKSMGYTAPSKDSEAVKSWQRDFLSNYATVITLNATAKSFLGSIANGSTVSSQRGNMDIETVQVHAKTAQAQAVVESAKTRLHAASEALAATRETNQNSTGILFEQQERLNHVNAKMESLKNSAPEMCIFNSTTIIRSYFSTFAGYASMWVRMSPTSIFPMLRMVEELSSFGGMGMDPRMISRKANEKQEFSGGQLMKFRGKRKMVSETNEKKQSLPSVSPEIATAISSGVGNSKRAAQQGIRTEADQSLLVKPLAKGSEF